MTRIWDDVISEEDRVRYADAGYGQLAGFGARPAIVMVDLYLTDLKPADTREFRDPPPPGVALHMQAIKTLLSAARDQRIPIFYSTNLYREDGRDAVGWRRKNAATVGHARALQGRPYPFIPEVAPRSEDWVVHKQSPSVFFGTPLVAYLIDLGIDTLLIGGQTTSGCVRATVTDSFAHGFRTIVVEECTYDRCALSHKVNLFDMHEKYADVVPLAQAVAYLARAHT